MSQPPTNSIFKFGQPANQDGKDQQKPVFSFPSTTNNTAGSIPAATATTAATTSSPFGITAPSATTTTNNATGQAFQGFSLNTDKKKDEGISAFSLNTEKKDQPASSFGLSFGIPSNAPATTGTSSTNMFGSSASGNNAATGASTGGSLFGKPGPGAPGASLFGNTANTSKPTTTTTTPSVPLFGSAAAAPKASTPSLFGAGTSTGGGLFGKPEEKKDGAAAPSLFGAQPAAGGLFGKPEEKKDGAAAPSLFGAQPAAGGLFGNKADDKQSSPAPSLFGAKPAAGGLFGKPEEKKDGAAAPSLFGAQPTAGSFSFGSKPAEGGPGLFGKKLGDEAASKRTRSDDASQPTGSEPKPLFGFGKPEEKKDSSAPATSLFGSKPDDKSKGGLFGAVPKTDDATSTTKPDAKADDAKKTSETLSESSKPIDTNKTDSKDAADLAAKKTSKLKVPTEQETAAYLQNRSLEDIISKWTTALTKRTSEFQSQASDIAAWDRVLSENGDRISQMYTDVVAAERKQSTIDQTLDYINRQQDDIEALLDTYEAQAQELLSDLAGPDGLQPVDQEREKAYRLAEDLNDKLEGMSGSLTTVINEINDVSTDLTGTKTDDDPLTQIVKVLNSHLSSLQWIDTHTNELQDKLEQIDVLKAQARDNIDVSNKLYGNRYTR